MIPHAILASLNQASTPTDWLVYAVTTAPVTAALGYGWWQSDRQRIQDRKIAEADRVKAAADIQALNDQSMNIQERVLPTLTKAIDVLQEAAYAKRNQ